MPRPTTDKHDRSASEVVLWIDNYSELFSDFDPRSLAERMVSDDFINQVKHAVREIPRKLRVLKLLVPEKIRQPDDEVIIRRRLGTYFSYQHEQLTRMNREVRRKGFYFSAAGLIFLLIASYLKELKVTQFYMTFLLTLLEPGGWFLLWTGFDYFMNYSGNRLQDVAFFNRMAGVHIEFGSY
jgi:hypothetical protein